MMEQILLHLLGDYITQTQWMAWEKVRSWTAALIHAFIYSIPFLMIGGVMAWLVIFLTHAVIDRFSLAKYLIWAKNSITPNIGTFDEAMKNFGYPPNVPAHVSFWLYVAADNTMHLIINYAALRWL